MFSNVSSTTMIVQNSSLYCATLNESGYSDWRLPSLSEFEYLRDVINLTSPSVECWTKEHTIVSNNDFVTYARVVYMSTNRNVMIGGELKTVCVR